MPGRALTVEHIKVFPQRIVVRVCCASGYCFTNPELIARVTERYPHILEHACINPHGDTFAAVACHTSLPHLLEHLVVDILAKKSVAEEEIFVGTSEWEEKSSGCARIELSYYDDLEVLAALKEASEFLDALASEVLGQ